MTESAVERREETPMKRETRGRDDEELRRRHAAVRIWRGLPVAEAIRQSGIEQRDLPAKLMAAWRRGARHAAGRTSVSRAAHGQN